MRIRILFLLFLSISLIESISLWGAMNLDEERVTLNMHQIKGKNLVEFFKTHLNVKSLKIRNLGNRNFEELARAVEQLKREEFKFCRLEDIDFDTLPNEYDPVKLTNIAEKFRSVDSNHWLIFTT